MEQTRRIPRRPAFRAGLISGAVAAGAVMWAGLGAAAQDGAPGLPPSDVALRVQGADLVDADGQPVTLRAINLGNWLLLEMWMLGGQPLPDQATFLSVLEARFGEAEARRLMGLYRAGWMTQRDFDQVAAAGFNCVRIPVSHVVLEREPFVLDEDGMAVLDSALSMAAQAGLYVIFDMHSVPGGQSLDQPSGDVTANGIWTDEEAQERLAWLWQHVARRFKNRPNFVAYDLINEPYGDFSADIRDELIGIVDRCVRAIREIDPDRLILAPGTTQSVRFYGDPAARGWTNVGFTEHFYPGVFDWRPNTLGTHARVLASTVRDRADLARSLGVPFLWGEYNPVFDSAGAHDTIRDVLDAGEAMGIHTAVWSHKILSSNGGVTPNNWYLVTNRDPLGLGDIRTASLATIEGVFSSLATMPLAIDQEYFAALTDPDHERVLPLVPEPPLTPLAQDVWTAWSAADIGAVTRGGGQAVAPGASPIAADWLAISSGGNDLFNNADSIRLVSRAMPSEFVVSGVFDAFEGEQYAQGGVTVRANANANAPHVSLVVFQDGRVLVKSRTFFGASTGQRYVGTAGFPVGLALGRDGGDLVAWITDEDGAWRGVPLTESPSLGPTPIAGFFGASNREGPLSVFEIDGPLLDAPPGLTAPPLLDAGTNLLVNASFEVSSGGSSSAASWPAFGEQMTRQTGWTPVRDGGALLAYRHWQVSGNGASGVWQDVSGLTPGRAYVFTVYANRDIVPGGRALADTVELRVETLESPARHLESVEFDVQEIATGSRWSRLQVRFIAIRPQHRVLIVATPGSGNRDGAVKFDGLVLEADPG